MIINKYGGLGEEALESPPPVRRTHVQETGQWRTAAAAGRLTKAISSQAHLIDTLIDHNSFLIA